MSEKRYTFECNGNNCQIFEDNVWLKIEEVVGLLNEHQSLISALKEENEQLRQVVEQYRKTNKHLSELCADASKNGYLPPLEDLR